MITKNTENLTLSDIEELINSSVPEGTTIEYKSELNIDTGDQKKEFLADISAFANSRGGHIIYGLKEEGGIATEITGLELENIDELKLRCENLTRDGLEPKLQIQIQEIETEEQKYIIVIHAAKSWSSPHRVIHGGSNRFYARNSAGKYQPDTFQLAEAFNSSKTIEQQAKDFRLERVASLRAGETPISYLLDAPKVALHIISLSAFGRLEGFKQISEESMRGKLEPMHCSGWNYRHNIDGFVTYNGNDNDSLDNDEHSSSTYTQLYRKGIIEAVESRVLVHPDGVLRIPSQALEEELVNSTSKYIEALQLIESSPPYVVMVSLIDVKGYKLGVEHRMSHHRQSGFDREVVLLPDILIESSDEDLFKAFQPIFDLIWAACGFSRCLHYDQDNNYIANQIR